MQRIEPYIHRTVLRRRNCPDSPGLSRSWIRGLSTRIQPEAIPGLPHIIADGLDCTQHPEHVRNVNEQLDRHGILKVSLRFPDDESQYLRNLVISLHRQHGHGLPISHSATKGWFWDVRPQSTDFQTKGHQARSETMQEFPWHTDCSYEECPPRFFALHILQPDRCGGGTLSTMKVESLWKMLSPSSRDRLCRPQYKIRIPSEFIKRHGQRHITGSILAVGQKGASTRIRFREELLTPLNDATETALNELKGILLDLEKDSRHILHLTSAELPRNSILLMDNYRWLHSRNQVQDPARHLRRLRWDATLFATNLEG
ncbi:CASlike [Aspergillus affinis]|uniref:CASlike n=1 Tax=Aspergillus affinis TaxID=1070780 RepID=UPI0022FDD743|nr:clavaminic acid synthetase-like protein [Aspergillus affinis]KAI9042918.1 CASlike [Aspergillus affinis]